MRKLGVGALCRLLPGFVLERDAKLRPIRDLAVLSQVDVLRDNLGDPQIAKRPARRLDGRGCCVLPGLRTCSDEVCHSVNAHATLLAIRIGCLQRQSYRTGAPADKGYVAVSWRKCTVPLLVSVAGRIPNRDADALRGPSRRRDR